MNFSGVHVTGTATLLDAQGNVLSAPVRMNDIGDFFVPLNSAGAFVRLQCADATQSHDAEFTDHI